MFNTIILKITFLLIVSLIPQFYNSQNDLVIVYRKSAESQLILHSENFPTEEIKKAHTENQQFIDEISYNGLEWYVVMSKLEYENQTFNESAEFPHDWIKKWWDSGYFITNLDYGKGKWLVVMTKGIGFIGQRWFIESDAVNITAKIKQAWDEKFRITCVAHGKGTYAFVMTSGSGLNGQTFHTSEEVPAEWINEKYNANYNVTYINHDGKYWFTVASTYDSQQVEKLRYYRELEWDKIQEEYNTGFWIYKICFKHLNERETDYLQNFNKAIESKDYELSIFYYTEALKIKPDDALSLNNRAWAKFKLGQCDGAVDDIDKSIKIDESAYSLHTKASILSCQKRYREAIDYFDKAISLLDKPESIYYFDRGITKEKIGDKEGAKVDFEKAISIEPTNVDYKVHYELFKQKTDNPVITWDMPFKSYSASAIDLIRIKLCVNSSLKVDNMKIYINNLLFESRGITVEDDCSQGIDQEIKLKPGKNVVYVEFNQNGELFKSEQRTIEYNPLKESSNYHALLISVEAYDDLGIKDLSKPIEDATNLKDVLLQNYSFDSTSIILLKNPKKEDIINELIKLQGELGEKDNLLIYYSGHGINKNEVGYWLPSDSKMESRTTWFSNSEFRDYVNGIKTEHTLVIADACFSGSIFSGGFRDVESFPCEEMAKVKSRRAMTSGANTVVPDESVFLKYICNILNSNEQSCLSAEELYSRIKPAVISNSPNNQIPQFGILPQVGDEGGNFVFRKKQ
jgi:tetratricopeptide (TPR) repeat protein